MMEEQVFCTAGGGVTAPKGFLAAGVACGIKKGRKDLAILYSEVPAAAAGTFTRNRIKAAPVLVTMDRVRAGRIQAVVVNSGNANACTGETGLRDAREMASLTATTLGIEDHLVAVASTGVIGVPLQMERIRMGIALACSSLSPSGGPGAAEAIMTTDTVSKEVALEISIGGHKVSIGGMAKGSGMIRPDMATMLCFITTDAALERATLAAMLSRSVERSFNMITVDGDTSTNDMVLAMANGMSGAPALFPGSKEAQAFAQGLDYVTTYLAKAIVRDGEGATKLIGITVKGARNREEAKRGAMAVANSSLVKTALFGADPNWGRVACALGYSGIELCPERISLFLGPIKVMEGGVGVPFDEGQARAFLEAGEISIVADLGLGEAEATVWTCDLSYDYIKINGSYRS